MAISRILLSVGFLVVQQLLSGCYVADFFRKPNQNDDGSDGAEVLGDDLGPKAGGRDAAALAAVYAVPAVKAPAGVRPDPDLLARRLLRQFRAEGTTLARVIGEVENYRGLLGGASLDFATAPANGYDATSVLTAMKVADEVCRALVDPNESEHQGWSTILPSPPGDVSANIIFLAQRITGVATAKLSQSKLSQLETLFKNSNSDNAPDNSDYVAPCSALVLDAQAMLL